MKNYNYALVILMLFLTFSLVQGQNKKRPTQKSIYFAENLKAPLNQDEKNKLKEVFSDNYETYILNNPAHLNRYKNLLRNRVKILEINNLARQKPCKMLSEVPLFDAFNKNIERDIVFNKKTFNALKYDFDFFASGNMMFKVDNTNYFIVIKSKYYR